MSTRDNAVPSGVSRFPVQPVGMVPRWPKSRLFLWKTRACPPPPGRIVRMPSLICSGARSDVQSSSSGIVRMILGAKKMSKGKKSSTTENKKAWALSENAWKMLLQCLDKDPEQAGQKYEKIRGKLIRLFEWKNFHHPEDLADETINRVARRIEEGLEIRAADPAAYFYQVARLVTKEEFRGLKRWTQAMMEHEHHRKITSAPPEETDARLGCLRRCVAALPPDQRDLILKYHAVDSKHRIPQRRQLALQLKIPLNALRIRACRIRSRLEDCVEKRFQTLQRNSL